MFLKLIIFFITVDSFHRNERLKRKKEFKMISLRSWGLCRPLKIRLKIYTIFIYIFFIFALLSLSPSLLLCLPVSPDLSLCPSVPLSLCPSVPLSLGPSVLLSLCPSLRLSVCLSVPPIRVELLPGF
jgi:hypothetical protein